MPRSRSSGQTTRRDMAPSRGFGTATAARPTAATATRPAPAAPPAVAHSSTPASHAAPHAPAAHPTPAPMQSAAPAAAGAGGGLLSGLAGTVMQGMAFGTGSAVAHRAVDAVMGPRQVEHVHKDDASSSMQAIDSTAGNKAPAMACGDETTQFQSCLSQNNGNLSSCQFFFDALTQCKQTMKM